jgi:hypothetical protein
MSEATDFIKSHSPEFLRGYARAMREIADEAREGSHALTAFAAELDTQRETLQDIIDEKIRE